MIPSFLLALFPAIVTNFLGALLSIVSSILSLLASTFTSLSPLFNGLSTFVVWFVKEFFTGLWEIIQNPATIIVIITLIGSGWLYLHHESAVNVREQVTIQKQYDARHPQPSVLKPLHRKVAPSVSQQVCDLFGCF